MTKTEMLRVAMEEAIRVVKDKGELLDMLMASAEDYAQDIVEANKKVVLQKKLEELAE